MRTLVLAGLLLFAGACFAKGGGVGLLMEGTISDLEVQGEALKFVLTGRFSFMQYPGRDRKKSRVDVDGSRGIPVTVVQWKPFFAMAAGGKAVGDPGALARILQAAVKHKHVVNFELVDAQLLFGRDGRFSVARASVIRATDADLR